MSGAMHVLAVIAVIGALFFAAVAVIIATVLSFSPDWPIDKDNRGSSQ